ncbi:MAG: hypothetical protein ACFB00_09900 [Parvularculaceae bacterium]
MSILAALVLSLAQTGGASGDDARIDAIRRAPDGPLADVPACVCDAVPETGLVTFEGVVRDAELRVGPDGRTVLPRQGTVFEVSRARGADLGDEARVYHLTPPAPCALTFDYGKRYTVRARRVGGVLESDRCIDPRYARDR